MYCPNCGTQVENNARFCYQCGNALIQNHDQPHTPRYDTAQQSAPRYDTVQPSASYSSEAKKAGVTIVFPDGHNELGDIYISATEIKFIKKSKAVRIAFGFIGSSIEKGEERMRLKVSDIAGGKRTRYGLNSNVYQITMNNGDVYLFCVNVPKTITYLEEVVGRR